ncbi:unnamed protein product [Brugia timori]|uniref:ZP domain-containing protein n=1 Tax=Brugia timori TaxID=42155 RepID=A0A0R3QRM3_9BILA|nr:unnamed protein product [Brugia timori]
MSSIGITELMDAVQMPTCTYSIHAESVDGPSIYHVWKYDGDTQGFLVHSCFVNDGRGRRYDLLDLDRCAIDPIIQPDVKYDGDLKKTVVERWGYKFSDTSVLNYQCVVELCKKSAGECESLTPPTCTSNSRIQRKKGAHDISDLHNGHQIDLVATISMLNNIEENGASDPRPRYLVREVSKIKNWNSSGIGSITETALLN